MVNLDQRAEEQLKGDLVGLITTARQYGYESEETKTYVQERVQLYQQEVKKDEFLRLGTTILYLIKQGY